MTSASGLIKGVKQGSVGHLSRFDPIAEAGVLCLQAQLQRELQKAKQDAWDAMESRNQHTEDTQDLEETAEMLTLDKEMAEEKAETLQLELDQAKEKIEELT